MYETMALLAIFALFYSTIAGAVERAWLSGPIVFTAFGLLVGPVGLGLPSWETDRETIRTLAEITLALVLFTDAAGADISVLKRTSGLPARLLLIGLPLTILLGFGLGTLLVDRGLKVLPAFLILSHFFQHIFNHKLKVLLRGPHSAARVVFECHIT